VHEFSICGLLLKALTEEYDAIEPAPAGLKSVTIVIGELHQIVPDYLQGAWAALTADTDYVDAELILEFQASHGICPACDWTGTISPPLFVCPTCKIPSVELSAGKELFIRKIEIKT